MAILDRFNRDEIGNTIEVLVALLDIWDAPADPEEPLFVSGSDGLPGEIADAEPDDDAKGDTSWTEWHTRGRHKDNPGIHTKEGYQMTEDVEDDDPDCGLDEGEPNFVAVSGEGAGCEISDPGGCQHDGREPDVDDEREQMHGDVPTLPVWSAKYNVFTDARQPIGFSNLMSTFVGQEIRSADTGAIHSGGSPSLRDGPGVPV